MLSAFAAYTIEKKTKLHAGEVPFGKGNIRGVAAPEALPSIKKKREEVFVEE